MHVLPGQSLLRYRLVEEIDAGGMGDVWRAMRRELDELRDQARYRYIPRYTLAWALGELGDIGGALEEFERSVAERDEYLQYPLFPGYDPIRSEPRFHAGLASLAWDGQWVGERRSMALIPGQGAHEHEAEKHDLPLVRQGRAGCGAVLRRHLPGQQSDRGSQSSR